MPTGRCPHCAARALSLWSELDSCPSCGRPLAKRDPRRIEAQVRERLQELPRLMRASRTTGVPASARVNVK